MYSSVVLEEVAARLSPPTNHEMVRFWIRMYATRNQTLAQYAEYLHGNCYRERKVVLDMYQRPNPATLRVESPDGLLPSFLSYFRAECAVASEAKEPVLLCVLFTKPSTTGTGQDSGRISLCTKSSHPPSFQQDAMQTRI